MDFGLLWMLVDEMPCLPACLQATRQSLLKKYGEIRHAMDRLHNTRLSNYERLECLDEIRRLGLRLISP